MREYEFEVRLCAHLERKTGGIVARQLGGGVHQAASRILDIVMVTSGPEMDRRAHITPETIPPLAIESDVGVGRARRWPAGLECHPAVAAEVRDEAIRVGFFERDRRNGADFVRQTVRYPDWFDAIVAIENKPSLDRPGDLIEQLRYDVRLGLVDRVVLATESHVTRAHLNRIPDEVGVWRIRRHGDGIVREVVREPTSLGPDDWGVEIGDRHPVRRDVRLVSPAAKRRTRVSIAERAYGRGWRSRLPDCEQASTATTAGTDSLPFCRWKDRVIDPGTCGPACPGHVDSEPPDSDGVTDRAERTPWDPAPAGLKRSQSGLDAF